MDRQKKSYILLAGGLALLVVVVLVYTIPGMRTAQRKAAEHAKSHMLVTRPLPVTGQSEPASDAGSPQQVRSTVVENLPVRTEPPKNPFRFVSPSEAPAEPAAAVGPGVRLPAGVPGDMMRQPAIMVPGGTVPAVEPPRKEPAVPALKGIIVRRGTGERLAVVHYDSKTYYMHPGERIDAQWKVVKIGEDAITLVSDTGAEVRVGMKGEM